MKRLVGGLIVCGVVAYLATGLTVVQQGDRLLLSVSRDEADPVAMAVGRAPGSDVVGAFARGNRRPLRSDRFVPVSEARSVQVSHLDVEAHRRRRKIRDCYLRRTRPIFADVLLGEPVVDSDLLEFRCVYGRILARTRDTPSQADGHAHVGESLAHAAPGG